MSRRPFIAGNWKMNTTLGEARALAEGVREAVEGSSRAEVALCPPFVSLSAVREAIQNTPLLLGAQNVFWEERGAFTGEISPGMLRACGCALVIVGHSERRQYFGETDATVNRRLLAALTSGLRAIVCVGEKLDERERGVTEKIVRAQLEGALAGLAPEQMAGVTIAYEPVWAIGTGKTATPDQAQDVHAFIRARLKSDFGASVADAVRIQYGGSVKPGNAAELFARPDIDGGLIGGASLKAADFAAIICAAG